MTDSRVFDRRPLLFRMLNAAWGSSYVLGTKIKLDKDDLIRTARKKTGLYDLGKEFREEPLERLLKSVNEEAELHPIGRFIARERFVSLLSIRLRAECLFKKYPWILDQELYPAWIILGLQRTGTTKLHRLLSVDPDHRFIPSWEVINPLPLDQSLYTHPPDNSPTSHFTGLPTDVHDKRLNIARTSARAVKLMLPGFYAIHPIEIFEPEEDILLLDVSFLSTTPEAMMHVPSYAAWLENTDQSEAYAYAAKLLKLLQWFRPAKRWILKTPHHLEFPDLIERYFGEVHYLWPHRNIYESVPSFLSMVTYTHMMFSDTVEESRIARHWVKKTGYMLQKALNYRLQQNHESKFTDILYQDFIKDSISELSRIYQLNGGLTPELSGKFRQHELSHPHRKYGTHQYSLADFDLTEADIDLHTGQYQSFLKQLYVRKQTSSV